MRQYQRAPRGYELMTLINPEVTDEALTTEVDYVAGLITTFGGEITQIKRDTPWGRRRLAYPIQRHRDATYVLFQFLATPSIISTIERDLKLDERVIRYLLVRFEAPVEVAAEPGAEGEATVNAGGEAATQPNSIADGAAVPDADENDAEETTPDAE
ncbi:MAG TPA: 30S ribosomal protein S6 [Nitrolancea sp.]|nr:30S ribosomal protein S6 [Nitrolancea sp.]